MPLYEYRCECGWQDERVLPFTNIHQTIKCGACGGRASRIFSIPAIHFKGTGFHNTDYRRKTANPDKTPESGNPDKPSSQEVKKDADKATTSPSKSKSTPA